MSWLCVSACCRQRRSRPTPPPSEWSGAEDVDTSWYSESGNGFELTTAAELAGLAQLVRAGTDFSGKTVTLAADVDLNPGYTFAYNEDAGEWQWTNGEVTEATPPNAWAPIGTQTAPFSGTFDGGGHTISGLYINSEDDGSYGLFGYVDGGAVRNVNVSGDVTCTATRGTGNVGGVVGYSSGSVESCSFDGSVTGGSGYAGGVVGQSRAYHARQPGGH